MSHNFEGITIDSLELLCLNKFNDSKTFYEEHKEELKQGITIPLRKIVLDMSDLMYDIDDKMFLDPVRAVSRIYCDTRGNRSKIKYRENMWVFFRRYKNQYPSAPFYYFQFFPNSFDYGLVFWPWKATHFKAFHELILEQPKQFLEAVKSCADAGFSFQCNDYYKKDRYPDAPNELKPFLSAKYAMFVYNSFDVSRIGDASLIDEIKLAFDIARPMYGFMMEAYERLIEDGLIIPEQ